MDGPGDVTSVTPENDIRKFAFAFALSLLLFAFASSPPHSSLFLPSSCSWSSSRAHLETGRQYGVYDQARRVRATCSQCLRYSPWPGCRYVDERGTAVRCSRHPDHDPDAAAMQLCGCATPLPGGVWFIAL